MSENYLMHFGNKNSGRYRRGSGEHPHQHDGLGNKRDWLTRTDEQGKGHYAKKGAAVGGLYGAFKGARYGIGSAYKYSRGVSHPAEKGALYVTGILLGGAAGTAVYGTAGAAGGAGLNIVNRIFGRKGK